MLSSPPGLSSALLCSFSPRSCLFPGSRFPVRRPQLLSPTTLTALLRLPRSEDRTSADRCQLKCRCVATPTFTSTSVSTASSLECPTATRQRRWGYLRSTHTCPFSTPPANGHPGTVIRLSRRIGRTRAIAVTSRPLHQGQRQKSQLLHSSLTANLLSIALPTLIRTPITRPCRQLCRPMWSRLGAGHR